MMAKEHGLGARLFLNEVNMTGDAQAVPAIEKSITTLNFTTIDLSAMARKAALLNGRIGYRTLWNPTGAHAELDDMPRTDVQVSYFHRATVGVPAASMVSKQTDYKHNRGNDGSFLADVENLSNSWWLDWGLSMTEGIRTDTGAANGAAVDFSYQGAPATSNFGLQAYLHVFAFTGTSATISLQSDTASNFASPTAVTGGAFTTVTGPTFERIQTARNQAVEQYLRVITTGTFSNLQFAVMCCVNQTDMSAV
jgi:hypothetical protein